jgi:hypothetical protein
LSNRALSHGWPTEITLRAVKAKEVADLVTTTDGIIFHLWSHDDKVPSGRVIIAQSVGHVNLTQAELKKGAQKKNPAANVSDK